jgi:hypothetical protein
VVSSAKAAFFGSSYQPLLLRNPAAACSSITFKTNSVCLQRVRPSRVGGVVGVGGVEDDGEVVSGAGGGD